MPEHLLYAGVDDFRAGIMSDQFARSYGFDMRTHRGNGAAAEKSTYGCVADSVTGALVPLPAKVNGNAQTRPVATTQTNGAPANYPTDHAHLFMLDGIVLSNITLLQSEAAHDPDGGAGSEPDYVATLQSFWYEPTGAGAGSGYYNYVLGRGYNLFLASNQEDTFAFMKSNTRVSGPNYHLHAGHLDRWLHDSTDTVWSPGTAFPTATSLRPVIARHVDAPHKSVWVNSSISTNELAMFNATQRFAVGSLFTQPDYMMPDPTSPTVQRILSGGSSSSVSAVGTRVSGMVSHQGRMVWAEEAPYEFGAAVSSTSNAAVSGWLHYTPYGRHRSTNPLYFSTGEESHSLFGSVGSLNANELVLIKKYGGAISIRGDLDNPSVFRYPGVESTLGVACRGVSTPLGYVYGSRSGVHAWAGGDSSKKLSDNIDGFFWDVPYESGIKHFGSRGRFAYWHPYVCVPNNWIMDTRTGSWWRLETADDGAISTSPYIAYDVSSATGKLYAFASRIGEQGGAIATSPFAKYDVSVFRGSYVWQSLPMVESTERFIMPKEFVLIAWSVAAAGASVLVTIRGYNQAGNTVTKNISFSLAVGAGPQRLSKSIGQFFEPLFNVDVKLSVQTTNPSQAAPKIFGFRLGYSESQMMVRGT